jgi:uncharacterized protein YjbI with pentapeptide repeats
MADFEQETVQIAELAGDEATISELSFEGCEVRGPAVILPQGCEFSGTQFEGALDALLWEIPVERTRVVGAILVDRCRFSDCTFSNIGIAGPPQAIAGFRAGIEES